MVRQVPPDSIGARIRAALKARNCSASELARKCGFSRQNMQRFIDGAVERSKHFPAIAKALGVQVDWLLTGDESVAPTWWKPTTTPTTERRPRRQNLGPPRTVEDLPPHWRVVSPSHGMLIGAAIQLVRAIIDPHRTPNEGDLILVSDKSSGVRIRRLGPTIANRIVLVPVDGTCLLETQSTPLGPAPVVVGVLFTDS
jgi:transcriptional regulator with XRE-family HTH domain